MKTRKEPVVATEMPVVALLPLGCRFKIKDKTKKRGYRRCGRSSWYASAKGLRCCGTHANLLNKMYIEKGYNLSCSMVGPEKISREIEGDSGK